MPCFAKSCQESFAGPATKRSILTFRGAKKSSSEKIEGNFQCRWPIGLLKSTIFFFQCTSKTRFHCLMIQLNFSCTRLNDRIPVTIHQQSERAQVRYSKTSKRLSSNFEDQYTFWKCRSFTVNREKIVYIVFIPRKIWCESFSESKKNIWNLISVSLSSPETKLHSKNVISSQNQTEKCFYTFPH